MRYFKKIDPRIKVMLSGGHWCQFDDCGNNTGIHPREGQGYNEWTANELALCIQKQIGGITEITKEEYDALIEAKKKASSQPSPPRWREEFKMNLKVADFINRKPKQEDLVMAVAPAGSGSEPAKPVAKSQVDGQVTDVPRPTASKPKSKK